MLPKDCKAIIFDMDGVLIDSETHYKVLEGELFDEIGVVIELEEHRSYQGSSNPVMWSLIKEKHGLKQSLEDLVARTELKVIQFFAAFRRLEPMPGILDLLQWLQSKGIKLALASSSSIDVISMVLDKSGLAPYFEVVVDCTEAGTGKPDPAIFLLAQKKLGLPKEVCIIIEDSVNGIKAAKAAGISCIAFKGPGSEHQDQSAADLIVNSFSEIPGFLKHS